LLMKRVHGDQGTAFPSYQASLRGISNHRHS
jgi:hypothetical protein